MFNFTRSGRFFTAAISSVVLTAVVSSPAVATGVDLAVKLSTLGPGIEASTGLSENFKFRLGVNGARFSKAVHSQSIKWQGRLRLLTVSGLLAYHPFNSGFYCAAGAMYNGNRLDLSLSSQNTITINGHAYTPAQIGVARVKATFAKLAPYLGLGYDAAFGKQGGFSMQMDLGVLGQGNAKMSSSATGLLANNATLLSDLQTNAQKVLKKSYVRFYPVAAIGFKYTF